MTIDLLLSHSTTGWWWTHICLYILYICQDFNLIENCNLINVVTIKAIAAFITAAVSIIDLTIEVCLISIRYLKNYH